jgi:DNA-binding NtrC family response regulator
MKILIVDDERAARRALIRILVALGDVELREASNLEEARRELAAGDVDVVLIDVRLDRDGRNSDGLTLVGEVRKHTSAVPIVVTGSHDMSQIRAAMRLGAYDYILKDELREEMVLPILQGLRSTRDLEAEVLSLRARQGADTSAGLVGTSPAIQRLRHAIQRVSLSDRPVLVMGPTGVGKEVVVRAIHAQGRNPSQPLLDLNCGAFPEALIESQLFGHERGAFTGADRRHDGFFTAVGSGTLFLDEIAELPLDLQAKLLRVLESGTYRPVGSAAALKFKGRVVAATHADLEDRVRNGQFREDLYYRLNVLEIRVPPLEERREDIPALVAHFAAQQERLLHFTKEAMELLQASPWPGNVRQLRNLVDRAAVFAADGPVTPEALADIDGACRALDTGETILTDLVRRVLKTPGGDKLQLIEQAFIDEALRLAGGNKTRAARLLGVHRNVVRRAERVDVDVEGDS